MYGSKMAIEATATILAHYRIPTVSEVFAAREKGNTRVSRQKNVYGLRTLYGTPSIFEIIQDDLENAPLPGSLQVHNEGDETTDKVVFVDSNGYDAVTHRPRSIPDDHVLAYHVFVPLVTRAGVMAYNGDEPNEDDTIFEMLRRLSEPVFRESQDYDSRFDVDLAAFKRWQRAH